MKKLLAVILLTISFSCYKKSGSDYDNNPGGNNGGNTDCGSYNGYTLYKDTEGCYYTGGNYSKVYVDATLCTCQ